MCMSSSAAATGCPFITPPRRGMMEHARVFASFPSRFLARCHAGCSRFDRRLLWIHPSQCGHCARSIVFVRAHCCALSMAHIAVVSSTLWGPSFMGVAMTQLSTPSDGRKTVQTARLRKVPLFLNTILKRCFN